MFYITDILHLVGRAKWVLLLAGGTLETILRILLNHDLLTYIAFTWNIDLLNCFPSEYVMFPFVSLKLFLIAWGVEKVLEAIERDFIALDKEIRALRDAQHTDKNH